MAKELKKVKPDIKLVFDICDPEWIKRPEEIKNMIAAVDFVVASTQQIKSFVINNYKKRCYIIGDGHDLEYYNNSIAICSRDKDLAEKKYSRSISGILDLVWYGNSGTIKSLEAIMPVLEKSCRDGDTLTVIANEEAKSIIKSKKIKVIFKVWEKNTVNSHVYKCNLALNPRLNTAEYRFKSNNKTVMAYILGLPCIDRVCDDPGAWEDDINHFRIHDNKLKDVLIKRKQYLKNYRIEKIVEKWQKALKKELSR